MDNRIIILLTLFITLSIIGCVQEKGEVNEVKVVKEVKEGLIEFEEIKDCQCHTQAYKYKSHVNGLKYCLTCHKIEKHPRGNWSEGYSYKDFIKCSKCHETSLLRVHMPEHTCVECHGDAKTIHQKFESKFLEGEK